jgi:flagellar protein FliO/FliZ
MIELLLRIGFSLLVVLGLMWVLAKAARRPLARRGSGTALAVLSRAQLGRNSSVAVVRVVDRALVLGVTDGQVNLLGETDLEAVQRQLDEASTRRDPLPLKSTVESTGARRSALQGSLLSPGTWSQTLDVLRERTARR